MHGPDASLRNVHSDRVRKEPEQPIQDIPASTQRHRRPRPRLRPRECASDLAQTTPCTYGGRSSTGRGWASVLKTKSSKGRSDRGAKSRYRYLSVSAKKKLSRRSCLCVLQCACEVVPRARVAHTTRTHTQHTHTHLPVCVRRRTLGDHNVFNRRVPRPRPLSTGMLLDRLQCICVYVCAYARVFEA